MTAYKGLIQCPMQLCPSRGLEAKTIQRLDLGLKKAQAKQCLTQRNEIKEIKCLKTLQDKPQDINHNVNGLTLLTFDADEV